MVSAGTDNEGLSNPDRGQPVSTATGRRTVNLLAIAAAVLLSATISNAQPASSSGTATVTSQRDSLKEIRMQDGSLLVGRVISTTRDTLVLLSTSGVRMSVPVSLIKDTRAAQGQTVRGEYWVSDPNKTRLFFGPTARPIGAGKGYLGTILVLLPFAGVGLGDNVSVAGGAPLLFGEFEPMYIAPKVTILQKRDVSLAVGTLAILADDNAFGVAFGMATYGDEKSAVTGGIGFGYAGTDVSGKPTLMLGIEGRMSRRYKLITENYFIPGARGGLMMGGVRIIGDKLSADIGVLGVVGGESAACCLPVINFAAGFGK
jgi:hypothetical protein